MGFKDPLNQRRDIARKVRLYPLLDRQLKRAADKSRREYATYLFEMLEWAAVNGAIEALMPDDIKDIAG
ncbi:hypothetical protein BFW91_01175 [Pseudomonas fluorescens]|uniref:hypothetical protein n=1 Tax=Pseudomonas fluorescens TaxID=294 RepID=UPI00099C3985|nr:hypothetical protein [Pseudomonas fluorescens]OPB16726.1 hypothetical protein BFW91_01175 [Pseudomonas fluorescens]